MVVHVTTNWFRRRVYCFRWSIS